MSDERLFVAVPLEATGFEHRTWIPRPCGEDEETGLWATCTTPRSGHPRVCSCGRFALAWETEG